MVFSWFMMQSLCQQASENLWWVIAKAGKRECELRRLIKDSPSGG